MNKTDPRNYEWEDGDENPIFIKNLVGPYDLFHVDNNGVKFAVIRNHDYVAEYFEAYPVEDTLEMLHHSWINILDGSGISTNKPCSCCVNAPKGDDFNSMRVFISSPCFRCNALLDYRKELWNKYFSEFGKSPFDGGGETL